ncbi:MAG: carbamoyl-phosphate synthase large subunit [Sphaerochaetaceae bacterium]
MPKMKDIQKILIIGSGPIVIGQGCEFDYSGTQALIALKEEGFDVVLVNPNPATMMSTPSFGATVYMEPLEVEYLERIIESESPDALLGTMGGQTALNLTVALAEKGILEKHGVRLLGVSVEAIKNGEDRESFKQLVSSIGLSSPHSQQITSLEMAYDFKKDHSLPLILRPNYTLGGIGGGIIEKENTFDSMVQKALLASTTHEVLIEQSLIGWMEFEMEVICDRESNAIVVCSIENVDPMGIHTGDSITVAPIINLSDRQYQKMRDASLSIIREVGIRGGGVNVQFAVNPDTGEMLVIEMNPRVSRSSALASKATGYAIARVSAKLAVGYTLDEVLNEITGTTSSSFEPALDYIAVKVPRFEIDKFPFTSQPLGTQMRSVGESLALGRTFLEALNKAIRGTEEKIEGVVELESIDRYSENDVLTVLSSLHPYRIHALYSYLNRYGSSHADSAMKITRYHPFIVDAVVRQVEFDNLLRSSALDRDLYIKAKSYGMSNRRIASLVGLDEKDVQTLQKEYGIFPVDHFVDTCAGEFDASTPYCYLTYDEVNESEPVGKNSIAIVASGPNRVGQGLEFDTCCTLASLAYKESGVHPIMINNNPETVSTDYSISDRLYLETLSSEEVINIVKREKVKEVVVQLGGQTPLKLLKALQKENIAISGTSYESLFISDERKAFSALLEEIGIRQSSNRSATSIEDVIPLAKQVGFPLLVRPSHVLGGANMHILYSEDELQQYLNDPVVISDDSPLLLDHFLEDAFEYDVDALFDGESLYICGILQHIEAAGVHSGDSAAVFPPYNMSDDLLQMTKEITYKIAKALDIRGFMNIQLASIDSQLYVIEVNPRASRTIPFLSKMSDVDIVAMAVNIWEGRSLYDQKVVQKPGDTVSGVCRYGWAIKEAVFSFSRFTHLDPVLGPQMRSTGEVVGIGSTFGEAYYKSQVAADNALPVKGRVCVSVNKKDREKVLPIVKEFQRLGFSIAATRGNAAFLFERGILSEVLLKEGEGHPNIVDHMRMGTIDLLINTPMGRRSLHSTLSLRQVALAYDIPYTTTLSAAEAALEAIKYARKGEIQVRALHHEKEL